MEDITIFLAKFWGWYMIIFFLILSLNPKRIKQIFEDLKDQKFALLASFLATIIGLLNILVHNVWEDSWAFIVTLIGLCGTIFRIIIICISRKNSKLDQLYQCKICSSFIYTAIFSRYFSAEYGVWNRINVRSFVIHIMP